MPSPSTLLEDSVLLTTEERIHAWLDEPGTGEWNFRPKETSSLWDLVLGHEWWLDWEGDEELAFWRPVYQHITRYSVDTYPTAVHFNLTLEMEWYRQVGVAFNDGFPERRFGPLTVTRTKPNWNVDKISQTKARVEVMLLRDTETLAGALVGARISPLEEGKPFEVLLR